MVRVTPWSAVCTLALTMTGTFGLSACFLADPGLSGATLRNETGRVLWIDKDPANDQSTRYRIELHDLSTLTTDECTDQRVEAQTRSGRVIAVLNQTWCPGQVWQITGQGDFVLVEHSP
jgi:hypothetical protein